MTMRTRSRSSAAVASADSSNTSEQKEAEPPRQTDTTAAAVGTASPAQEQPPSQPPAAAASQQQSQPQSQSQHEAVDLTSPASSTRRASRRSSAASRSAAARQPRRRASTNRRDEEAPAAIAALATEAAQLAQHAAQQAAEASEAKEEKEEHDEEEKQSESEVAAAADSDVDVVLGRPPPRTRTARQTARMTARTATRRSTGGMAPAAPVRRRAARPVIRARRSTSAPRASASLATAAFSGADYMGYNYDSAQDEDYEEPYFSESASDELLSDEDEKEEAEVERLYNEARDAGAVAAAQEAVEQYFEEVANSAGSSSRGIWVDRAPDGGVIVGIPRQQVQHHQQQQHQYQHQHVHDPQQQQEQEQQIEVRMNKINRTNIKERMAKKTTPKAKRGKPRKGKRRRSSVAVKEEEMAALLSQLEGPPSVPPMSCAEVDSLFRLASRVLEPANESSSSSSSPSEPIERKMDYIASELSPFHNLFSDVRSLGASFLRTSPSASTASSSSSSSSSALPSAPVSPVSSAFAHMVDVEQLKRLEVTHGWNESYVVYSPVELKAEPLFAFIDEWLAGQLPEPPVLVIDDTADEEAGRAGKKRKGPVRTMSMVSWLQLMNAGIDPTTGGDVVIHGGDAVPSTVLSSQPARASIDSGMIDLTEDGDGGSERKEAVTQPTAMEVEDGTKRTNDEVKMKDEKGEKVNDVQDEDQPINLDDQAGANRSRATQFILDYHQGLASSSSASSSSSSSSLPAASSEPSMSLSSSASSSLPAPSPPLPILTLVRNCVLTLLELRIFDEAQSALYQSLRFLPNSTQLQQLLTLYFASLSPDRFQQHIIDIHHHLTFQLTHQREVNESTMGALHLLSTLFSAYQLARTRQRLLVDDVSLFTNDVVCTNVDIYGDYHFHFMHKLNSDSRVTNMHQFTWTRHCRFLYTTEVKSEMIRHWLDAHWTQEQVQQAALPTQALTIHLSRQRLVPDLLNAIARTRMERGAVELRKPLHVVFSGEEGIDAGGLKKEAVTLACDSMFNAQYGMFLWNDETRTFWFNSHCQAHDSVDEMKGEYQLLGTVIGMALLNNVLLPNVAFPPVVYAKLLGLPLSFIDLQTSFPQLHQSLCAILNYSGEEPVEEVFSLTFSVDSEVMGSTYTHPLLPNGETIPVTAANRHEYVKLFTKYQLEDSIAIQFDAFARGFWSVLPRHLLAPLLQPADLELLVCGQREMDFEALEAATKYEGFPVRGRHSNHAAAYAAHLDPFAPAQPVTAVKPAHPVIRHFWSIVRSLDTGQKKQLLHFVTGSASVPVKGLSEVKLVIANGGNNVQMLPSSRTCFSTLMLPLYKTEAELRKKLLISIEHNTGFGMK